MLRNIRTLLIWLILLLAVLFAYANWKIWRTEVQLERFIARSLAPGDSTAGMKTQTVTISVWNGTVRLIQPELFTTAEDAPARLRDVTLHLGRRNSLMLGILPAQHVLMKMDTLRVTAASEDAFFAELLLTDNPIYSLALLAGDLRPERPVRITLTADGLNTENGARITAVLATALSSGATRFQMTSLHADLQASSSRTTLTIQVREPSWLPAPGALGQYEGVLQIFGVATNRFDFTQLTADFDLTPDDQITSRAVLRHYGFTASFDGLTDAHSWFTPADTDSASARRLDQLPVSGFIRIDQMIEPLDNAIFNVERLFRLSLRREQDAIVFPVSGTLGQPRVVL